MLQIHFNDFNNLNTRCIRYVKNNYRQSSVCKYPAVINSNSFTAKTPLYPAKFYSSRFDINFSGGRKTLSLQEQVDRLNLDILPQNISNAIQNALKTNDKQTLYDIHTELFSPLSECKTLNEAKILYPEFQDVLDAKNLPENLMSPTLIKIKNNKIEGINLENLSLELLKTHYAKGISPNSRDAYFGLSKDASLKIFETLNIKRLDGTYLRLLGDCSPEKRERVSKSWTEEKRKQHSITANKIWDNQEKRQAQSEKRKNWFQNHPEAAEEISKREKGKTHSAETRAKISQSKQQFYKDNPEFAQLRSESFQQHEDFRAVMSEIARKKFPYLRIIFLKQATGKKLEDYEVKYMERYHKKCEELYPNGQKMAGETFSKLWQEYKADKKS